MVSRLQLAEVTNAFLRNARDWTMGIQAVDPSNSARLRQGIASAERRDSGTALGRERCSGGVRAALSGADPGALGTGGGAAVPPK